MTSGIYISSIIPGRFADQFLKFVLQTPYQRLPRHIIIHFSINENQSHVFLGTGKDANVKNLNATTAFPDPSSSPTNMLRAAYTSFQNRSFQIRPVFSLRSEN